MTLMQSLLKDFLQILRFFGFDSNTDTNIPTPPPIVEPATTTPVTEPPMATTTLQWDTRENIIHSIRVIADEEGLPLARTVNIGGKLYQLKDTLQATIQGESDFNLNAINRNYAFKANGEKYIASTDYGLCQWNDFYHKNEITPDEALHNPEKACRLMARYWKQGEKYRRQWIAYKGGRFLAFLPERKVEV